MKMKNFAKLILLVLALVVLSVVAQASNGINVTSVKINGEDYTAGENLRVELGSQLTIKMKLLATDNVSDFEVAGRLIGYDHSDVEPLRTYDVVSVDKMVSGDVEYVTITLDVPTKTDKSYYNIRVYVEGREVTFDIIDDLRLNVVGKDNQIDVMRVSFDPAEVVAGRSLRIRAKLDNLGEADEENMYVKVSIPALGPSAVVTADVDTLDSGDSLTSEDLLLRIPSCAKEGVYEVITTVEYDDGYSVATKKSQITVLSDETCVAKNVAPIASPVARTVIVPPMAQDITAGVSGVSFPIVITNEGNTNKVYTVTVSGVSGWGVAQIANPAPMVQAGQTEVVYVYVTANEKAAAGKQVFEVKVAEGQDSKVMPVTANIVQASGSFDLKNALYIGVIVLLVLVIILGLVIGFGKSKGNNDKEYY